ncbi:MAG: hypothetical protein HYV35_02945 [Lentisphaerae bacterium]|nr:hypothetical protein [Lentisphaerota bacterium]
MMKKLFSQQIRSPRWETAVWFAVSLALFLWAGLVRFGHGETLLGLWATIVPEGIIESIHGNPHWGDTLGAIGILLFWTVALFVCSGLFGWAITAVVVIPFGLQRKDTDVEKREESS